MSFTDVNDLLQAKGPDGVRAFMDEAAQRDRDEARRKALSPFVIGSALMRMVFPPLKFTIPGFVCEGCTMLAGPPKIGKSWLTLDWALAVDTGGYAFGSVKCERGDVLFYALEDNNRRLQRRMKALAQPGDPASRICFATEAPRIGDGLENQIRAWHAAVERPRLVIIDVLERVRPIKTGERGYGDDYAAVAALTKLAGELGVAIVVIHHTRKMAADDPFEAVSGTFGLSGGADAVMVLQRGTNGTTLFIRGRDVEEAEHAVRYDPVSFRWSVLGKAEEVHRTDERKAVIEFLSASLSTERSDDIARAMGKSRNAIDLLLFKMLRAGEVERFGRGLYQLPGFQKPGKNGKKERNDDEGDDEDA